jgi:hypothetical protein
MACRGCARALGSLLRAIVAADGGDGSRTVGDTGAECVVNDDALLL